MHKNKKIFLNLFFTLFLIPFAISGNALAQTTDTTSEAEEEIKDLEKDLKKAEAKQDVLEGSLNSVNSQLSAKQQAINQAAGLVANTEETIQRKTSEIANLEKQINLHTEVLRQLVQELYYIKTTPLIEVMLDQNDFDSFVSQGDNILTTGEKLNSLLEEIQNTRQKIEEDQEELQAAKDEQRDILQQHNLEKQDILEDKSEISAELDEQSKVVAKINKEISELQGDLEVVTGKSYSASNIKEAVSFASNKTGVPKGFLYGVLKIETNLGKNVGGCTYAEVEKGATANYKKGNLSKKSYQTFLNRRKTFKTITDDLGLDYKKQKVSCNPSNYRGTGGAMGVAQFMPDTWIGYKAQVASVTGHKKPSPWDLTDGVTAMALKLKKTPGVTEGKTSAMKQATCSYLGVCLESYYGPVLYWAKNYKQLL